LNKELITDKQRLVEETEDGSSNKALKLPVSIPAETSNAANITDAPTPAPKAMVDA